METTGSDDDPPPEPRDGWLLIRIHVPELNVYKCLQFPADRLVWDIKQQVLTSLPKELKESFNYGLFCPPSNGKAGKFLDEERRLGDYPFNGPVGYLELKYKRRVYKMLNLDEKQLKALHTRANLRRFLECINGGHVEKIAKMCAKGLDPNFHCPESGETPLTVATGTKKPNKLLIALVNGGALLDYRTKDGSTALHKAVERDSLEAVTTLLELGASPNYKDSKGLTPVYLSVTRKTDPKICESLLHDHATLGITDNQGWHEVHQACRHGFVQHLEHLLFYGADMDSRNASGNTPLHVCAVNNQETCARMLLFRGANRDALNYANQTPYQVAVIAGNLELAEIIQKYKSEDIVPFRGPPRYNPRRRSGIGWIPCANINGGNNSNIMNGIYGNLICGAVGSLSTTSSSSRNSYGPPSPCPSSEHIPYSSASSSVSEGSSGHHRLHEDDISIVTDKSLGDTSDIISDSSGIGTNSDSAACSINDPSTTVVCIESYAGNSVGHIRIQPGEIIEIVGSTDCGLLEGYIRGTNRSGFFPAECVQEVSMRQKTGIKNHSPAPQYQNPLAMGAASSMTPSIISNAIITTTKAQPSPPLSKATLTTTNTGNINGSQFNSSTAPRIKKVVINEPRTVTLHRAKRGFGFILRGAKASSPLMQLKPSERFPALQYLDDVDPGGVADMAGLRPGDFLLAINGEDVRASSHEHVVDLIRSSGALVSMTVVSPCLPNNHMTSHHHQQQQQQHLQQQQFLQQQGFNSAAFSARQCATLPRKMSLTPGGKLPAPAPPRRDPKTTLSVGRARAKSMVAGLEVGSEKDDDDIPAKSSSIESISTTPTQNPGTPVQSRTASIKARPTSSRITAAELEELFQRQQGESTDNSNRYSTMMTSSRFQSGTDTPPAGTNSPHKGPLVYASVAEMKRKKMKNGTLRGKPCPIPSVNGMSDLKRNFHSTPDLNLQLDSSSSSIWTTNAGAKGHHSQDDMNTIHVSMQRLINLPPPNHPPPPPPVGQVVKVDVSRSTSEYESTVALQKKLSGNGGKIGNNDGNEEIGVVSSFNPSTNAKLYASPQDIKTVGFRARLEEQKAATSTSQSNQRQPQQLNQSQYAQPGVQNQQQQQQHFHLQRQLHATHQQQHGNQMTIASGQQQQQQIPAAGPAPPIPEPDYSLSESEGEDENSILVARNTKLNEKIGLIDIPNDATATTGSNNTSGSNSSGGSNSMAHSFSVDEIQKMRVKLKTSKSYPNDLLRSENQQNNDKEKLNNSTNNGNNHMDEENNRDGRHSPALPHDENDEGDNSSSGVSSDQEIPANNTDTIKKKPPTSSSTTTSSATIGLKLATNSPQSPLLSSASNVMKKIDFESNKQQQQQQQQQSKLIKKSTGINEEKINVYIVDNDDNDKSPSPPAKGFQRHNSLTRKQAAAIAMNRAARNAVSLTQLPPPIEDDVEIDLQNVTDVCNACPENLVLAPPPEFCDCNDIKMKKISATAIMTAVVERHSVINSTTKHGTRSSGGGGGGVSGDGIGTNSPRARIVGAVPKANRMQSQ